MILSELKEYLIEHKVVSMHDLTLHFDTDAETLREMLEIWIRKGKVRKVQEAETKCQKCAQCSLIANEFYEWLE